MRRIDPDIPEILIDFSSHRTCSVLIFATLVYEGTVYWYMWFYRVLLNIFRNLCRIRLSISVRVWLTDSTQGPGRIDLLSSTGFRKVGGDFVNCRSPLSWCFLTAPFSLTWKLEHVLHLKRYIIVSIIVIYTATAPQQVIPPVQAVVYPRAQVMLTFVKPMAMYIRLDMIDILSISILSISLTLCLTWVLDWHFTASLPPNIS